MLKIRWSHDRLMFNMGISIPEKDHLYSDARFTPNSWGTIVAHSTHMGLPMSQNVNLSIQRSVELSRLAVVQWFAHLTNKDLPMDHSIYLWNHWMGCPFSDLWDKGCCHSLNALLTLLSQFMCLPLWKRKKMENFMCLFEFECATHKWNSLAFIREHFYSECPGCCSLW